MTTTLTSPRPQTLSHTAWRRVAAAMFVIGWGGNQFTPLLMVYRDHDGYSQVDVDVFLGAYVVGLIPGLLIASALSDQRGRRPVMIGGLVCSVLGSLLLAAGSGLGYPGIFAGRAFGGAAVGVAMAVGSAWVTELSAADPTLSPGAGARRATLWLTAGLALGPASAGLLAQFARPALLWPFAVHVVLCLPATAALLTAHNAETVRPAGDVRDAGTGGLLRRLRVPAAGHRRFLHVVMPMAPWIFGSAGIAYAIVPQLVDGALGDRALLFTAALTVATLGTGVLVQPIARRLDHVSTARAVVVSMLVMTAGVVMAAVTAAAGSPWLAVPVALLLGAAYGIAVVSGLLEVQRIAGPDELAGLTGVYYALAYVGFLLPAALAWLSTWFGYPLMLAVVAAVCLLCTVVTASGWARHLPSRAE
ncbi:MFS transporter [Kineosporia sp. J2-2]|uniref:MFS transporter n=1 Tax=Kineosporia corallincola TaxID=2835133 RepID=A0ABS5TCI1_9ACTN|nr:MFS transporter [Kineosporia corallincola]MBT0768792.1 MFS transporter [Kineosporia corallincola]